MKKVFVILFVVAFLISQASNIISQAPSPAVPTASSTASNKTSAVASPTASGVPSPTQTVAPITPTNSTPTNKPGSFPIPTRGQTSPPVAVQSVPPPPVNVVTNRPPPTNAPILKFPAFPAPEPEPEDLNPAQSGPPSIGTPPRVSGPNAGPPRFGSTNFPSIASGATNTAAGQTNAESKDDMVLIRFPNAPLEQLLNYYSGLVGKTILRAPTIQQQAPQLTINLLATTPLTKAEAKQALDTVLALNQITMVPMGDKFMLAVPATQAMQEGVAFNSTTNISDLPEAAQFITEIVHLTNALPSEVVPSISVFGKLNATVPIDSAGILVLRDYAVNVKRMLEIIKKIDTFVEPEYKLEVIPIKYGKVEEIHNVMSSLIGGGGGGGTPTASSRSRSTGRSSSISSRNRTRTPTNPNQPGQMQPQATQPASQGNFQSRLQSIINRAAGGDNILGDARIIPDERNNSLVVYANKHDMKMITNIVDKLDVMLAQVLIEAVIIDASLKDGVSYGVSALQNQQKVGKFTGVGGMNNGQPFLSSLTNLSSGLPSGFSYFGKWAGDMDIAVSAFASDNNASILQRPRIQTTHAVQAGFSSGATVPYINSTYYGGYSSYGPSASYQEKFVGIELMVTPYITPDGLVVMEIEQTIDELAGYTKIGQDEVPNTTTRHANSTVSVQNGETIILGGFIRTSKSRSRSGVPLLKDIPVLGMLFSSNSKNNDRSELIVLMRPTVLNNPKDASQAAKTEMERLPGVQAVEREFQEAEKSILEKSKKKSRKK